MRIAERIGRMLVPVALLSTAPAASAMADETMTPEALCAQLPEPSRPDCIAAGKLLTAPLDRSAEPELTLKLTADGGALTAEYRHLEDGSKGSFDERFVECSIEEAIHLPGEADVHLLFTSLDTVYTIAAPGLFEPVYLIPGRINERSIRTPAASTSVESELRSDDEGVERVASLRFVSTDRSSDIEAPCEEERSR